MDINIDRLIEENNGKFKAKKSPVLAIAIIVAGLIVSYIPVLTELSKNSGIIVASTGILLILGGFFSTFFIKSAITYLPTNEKLKRKEYFFDQQVSAEAIDQMIKTEAFEEMEKLASKNPNAPHMVVSYRTASKSCAICQHFKFVPYQYEAVGDLFVRFKE